MVAKCKASTATIVDMVSSLIKQVSKSKWLFIDSVADQTQRQFYELVRLGIADFPFSNLLGACEFYGNMTTILDTYAQLTSVTRFNIEGDHHVWLQSEGFLTVTSRDGAVLGKVLSDWLVWCRPTQSMPSKYHDCRSSRGLLKCTVVETLCHMKGLPFTYKHTNWIVNIILCMALHRKLRGIVGGSPQYVRIPASRTSNQTVSYSLQETHVRAQRIDESTILYHVAGTEKNLPYLILS